MYQRAGIGFTIFLSVFVTVGNYAPSLLVVIMGLCVTIKKDKVMHSGLDVHVIRSLVEEFGNKVRRKALKWFKFWDLKCDDRTWRSGIVGDDLGRPENEIWLGWRWPEKIWKGDLAWLEMTGEDLKSCLDEIWLAGEKIWWLKSYSIEDLAGQMRYEKLFDWRSSWLE